MNGPAMPDSSRTPQLRLREFLPYRLSVLSNTISRRIADIYDREFGLSIWQWRVMAVTGDAPGISATEIGQRTAMDKVAVSRAVAGLIEVGYLERKSSEEDARRSMLFLTPAGQAVYDDIVPMAISEEQALESVLTPEERQELTRLMEKLAPIGLPLTGRSGEGGNYALRRRMLRDRDTSESSSSVNRSTRRAMKADSASRTS